MTVVKYPTPTFFPLLSPPKIYSKNYPLHNFFLCVKNGGTSS